jgi:hypothetical protein
MKVLVSDTSVLIDLERGGFVEAIFSLPYQFAVPDVLYYGELEGEWGTRLVGLGLRIEETSSTGVSGGGGGSHFGGPGGATPRMLDGGEWRQGGVVNKHSALRAGIFKA